MFKLKAGNEPPFFRNTLSNYSFKRWNCNLVDTKQSYWYLECNANAIQEQNPFFLWVVFSECGARFPIFQGGISRQTLNSIALWQNFDSIIGQIKLNAELLDTFSIKISKNSTCPFTTSVHFIENTLVLKYVHN